MPSGEVSVAAATAVVGYDLFVNEWFQIQNMDRTITGIGVAGSTAALDTEIELFAGTKKIGNYKNKAAGAVLMDAHRVDLEAEIEAGEMLHAYVTDAPATNPINVQLEWDED